MMRGILLRLLPTVILLTVSLVEAQQSAKIPRIGFLSPGSAATFQTRVDAFRQGLRDFGYIEGENIFVDYRYAEGKQDLITEQAIELVRLIASRSPVGHERTGANYWF